MYYYSSIIIQYYYYLKYICLDFFLLNFSHVVLSFNVSSILRLNTELFNAKIMSVTDATVFLQKYFTFYQANRMVLTFIQLEIMPNQSCIQAHSTIIHPGFFTCVLGIFLTVTNSNFCSTRLQKNFILPFSGFPDRGKSNRPRVF